MKKIGEIFIQTSKIRTKNSLFIPKLNFPQRKLLQQRNFHFSSFPLQKQTITIDKVDEDKNFTQNQSKELKFFQKYDKIIEENEEILKEEEIKSFDPLTGAFFDNVLNYIPKFTDIKKNKKPSRYDIKFAYKYVKEDIDYLHMMNIDEEEGILEEMSSDNLAGTKEETENLWNKFDSSIKKLEEWDNNTEDYELYERYDKELQEKVDELENYYRNKSGFTREDVQEFYLRKNVLCDEMEKKYEVLASYIKNHYLYISLKKKKRELKKLKTRNERIYYILRKTYFNWTLIQQAVLSHRFSPVLEYSPIEEEDSLKERIKKRMLFQEILDRKLDEMPNVKPPHSNEDQSANTTDKWSK